MIRTSQLNSWNSGSNHRGNTRIPSFLAALKILAVCLVWPICSCTSPQLVFGQIGAPIVLRDLTLIRDRTIANFDNSSITLSDGSHLGWDQVLQASIEASRQAEFDDRLKQIGLPLFRLKSRIRTGDWTGAGAIAESIDAGLAASESITIDADTVYLVCLATMKSRIERGDRAGALIPFIRAAMLQPQVHEQTRLIAGRGGIPELDQESGISRELLPIWFDLANLVNSGESLTTQLENLIQENATAAPGPGIYLASIKIELGQIDAGLRILNSLDRTGVTDIESWLTVLKARIHQKTNNAMKAQALLQSNESKLSGLARLVGLYYLGLNARDQPDLSDSDYSTAILTLLRIPAGYGDQQRDLAAAALFQSAEIAQLREHNREATKLGDELLRRYPRTYHGRLESNRRSSQKQ